MSRKSESIQEDLVEKKNQKMRWRYFIDKPFQTRFIVRFAILILVGFALSLGSIFLLDNFKFVLGTLHFRAKNIEEMKKIVTSINHIENSLLLLQNPTSEKEASAAVDSITKALDSIVVKKYQLPTTDLSNLSADIAKSINTLNSNLSFSRALLGNISAYNEALISLTATNEIALAVSDIRHDTELLKVQLQPAKMIRSAVADLRISRLSREISAMPNVTKNPVNEIDAVAASIESSGTADPAALAEIRSSLDLIRRAPLADDSIRTIGVLERRLPNPPSPEEIFAVTLEKRGINSLELYLLPILYVSLIYLILIAVFGLFISHRMAGPVYRIKRTLQEAAKGGINIKELEFRLRKRDELQDLVEALNRFLDKINDRAAK
jgi:HAMP domain-containing protein